MFARSSLDMLAGMVFTSLLVLAGIRDLQTRRIPNPLVLTLAVLGFAYSAMVPATLWGALWGTLRAFEGFGVGMACWLPFYVLNWLGAGDVKLFAAAGAWLGPGRAVEGSVIAALAGGVLGLIWMLHSRGLRDSIETLGIAATLPGVLSDRSPEARSTRSLPYGVALAAGAICAGWMPGLVLR